MKADIFSLGVVLWEIITLERPAWRGNLRDIRRALLLSSPLRPLHAPQRGSCAVPGAAGAAPQPLQWAGKSSVPSAFSMPESCMCQAHQWLPDGWAGRVCLMWQAGRSACFGGHEKVPDVAGGSSA
jgi:hypothetical protein